MGGRYWLTGAEIGMMLAFIEHKRFEDLKDLVKKIENQSDHHT